MNDEAFNLAVARAELADFARSDPYRKAVFEEMLRAVEEVKKVKP